MADLFRSIATTISEMASAVRDLFIGEFDKVIRLVAYMVGGPEAVGLVEHGVSMGGGAGVAAAAGNRTTTVANTTNNNNNTINGAGVSGDMAATINLTVDLGRNQVFHDAVMTVLHAEARN